MADTPAQRPLTRKQEMFVHSMVHDGDEKSACTYAGLPDYYHKSLLKNQRVLDEIQRRKDLLIHEQVRIEAKRRVITREKLDDALMQVVDADISKTPTLAPSKVRAIEIGYEAIGASIEGVFIPENTVQNAAQTPAAAEAPRIFRATEARIITHSMQTTTETTVREVVSAEAPQEKPAAKPIIHPWSPPPPAPPVIDAKPQPKPKPAPGKREYNW